MKYNKHRESRLDSLVEEIAERLLLIPDKPKGVKYDFSFTDEQIEAWKWFSLKPMKKAQWKREISPRKH